MPAAGECQVPRIGLARIGSACQEVIGGAELRSQRGRGAILCQLRQDDVGYRCRIQPVYLASTLIGAEKEPLTLPKRAPKGRSELVLFEVWLGLARRVPEERVGVEKVVADEFPTAAVELVLAALGDQVRTRNLGAIDGIVVGRLDFEFRDRVGIGDSARGGSAIHGVGSGRGVAVHVDTLRAASQSSRVVHIGGGARGHGEHLSEVARVQGDRGDCLSVNQGSRRGRRHTQTAAAGHPLGRVSRLQARIQYRRLGDIDDNRGHARRLETRRAELHFISPRRQQRESVAAIEIGDRRLAPVGRRSQDRDVRGRDGSSLEGRDRSRQRSRCSRLAISARTARERREQQGSQTRESELVTHSALLVGCTPYVGTARHGAGACPTRQCTLWTPAITTQVPKPERSAGARRTCHSLRSAATGSTRAARHAGT